LAVVAIPSFTLNGGELDKTQHVEFWTTVNGTSSLADNVGIIGSAFSTEGDTIIQQIVPVTSKHAEVDVLISAFARSQSPGSTAVVCADYAGTKQCSTQDISESQFSYISIKYNIPADVTNNGEVVVSIETTGSTLIDEISSRSQPDYIAAVLAFFTGISWWVSLYPAFYNLAPRPAVKELPKRDARCLLLRETAAALWATIMRAYRENPAVLRYLFGYSVYYSVLGALISLTGFVLTEAFALSSTIVGLTLLMAQLSGAVFALLYSYLGRRIGFIAALKVSLVQMAVGTIGVLIIPSPQAARALVFPLGIIIGGSFGGTVTLYRGAYSSMIPLASEAQYMGLFAFCGVILSWLAPLVFTLITQTGAASTVGYALLAPLLLIPFLSLFTVSAKATLTIRTAKLVTEDNVADLDAGVEEVEIS
jgi:hypothetical protein